MSFLFVCVVFQTKLEEQEKYLLKAKEERLALRESWRVVTDWLKNTDSHVLPSYKDTDHEPISELLEQHKVRPPISLICC